MSIRIVTCVWILLLLLTVTAPLPAEEAANADSENKLPEIVKAALEQPEALILYSLEPNSGDENPKATRVVKFHDVPILGETKIVGRADQQKLAAAFFAGVKEIDFTGAVGCFAPRHGMRITHKKKTVDLIICFECITTVIYVDGKHAGAVLNSGSPQPTFDKLLKAAKVALAKPPAEDDDEPEE